MKYKGPMGDYERMVSNLTCIIDIPTIDNQAVNVRLEYRYGDEHEKLYIDGYLEDVPDNLRLPLRLICEREGIEATIWQMKNNVLGLYQIGYFLPGFKKYNPDELISLNI